ncbi:MAG: hypothetical protein M1836_006642 [Candelina mexicana]|nr:MAG: hypothetical protein M1836_006642 [Candelina mexicana]
MPSSNSSGSSSQAPIPQDCQRVDRQGEALWSTLSTTENAPFLIYDDSFLTLLGPNPKLKILIDDSRAPFFHEAGAYIPSTDELFITSSVIRDPAAVSTAGKSIQITRIQFFADHDLDRDRVGSPTKVSMANGGTTYRDGVVFCAQGSLSDPAGLVYMEAKRPHKTRSLITNYHGRHFNSPNDVVVHSDGSLWFTDPCYGYEQGFRPKPQLPNQVYRFNPDSGDIRVVADGFARPNGIAFTPNERRVYITDTDYVHGDGTIDPTRASTIYAFDVTYYSSSPFLTNRRVFAMADNGIPDGIKCDIFGNVYSGCGDGINVWNPGGSLIGKILVEGGIANFCFGRNGELFLFNETRLWRANLARETKGALLRI